MTISSFFLYLHFCETVSIERFSHLLKTTLTMIIRDHNKFCKYINTDWTIFKSIWLLSYIMITRWLIKIIRSFVTCMSTLKNKIFLKLIRKNTRLYGIRGIKQDVEKFFYKRVKTPLMKCLKTRAGYNIK